MNQNFVEQSQQLNAPPSNGIPGGGVRSIAALNYQNLFCQGSKGKSQITVHFGIVLTTRYTKIRDYQKLTNSINLNSLLEGRALRAIQGLTVTEDNYEAAVEILQQRFGKTQQTIFAHMDELMKIPTCNSTDKPSQLRHIYDKISVHTRGLASLGVDSKQYGSLLIPVIMAKLPQEVRIRTHNQERNLGHF